MTKKKTKKQDKVQNLANTLPTKAVVVRESNLQIKVTNRNKIEFLAIFFEKRMSVSKICEDLGVCRNVYYYWMKHDPLFKMAIQEGIEKMKDYAESCIIASMPEDWKAAAFWLKIHAKDRGYKPDAALSMEDTPTEDLTIHIVYDKPPKKVKRIESVVIENEGDNE